MKLLLAGGADDVNSTADGRGWSALMLAADRGHLPVVRLLLEKDVDLEVKDFHSVTALMLAAHETGYRETPSCQGAPMFNVADTHGVTPLMEAASYGCTEMVRLLLAHGADVNVRAGEGAGYQTALKSAASNRHTEVVKLLLDNGADVDVTDIHIWLIHPIRTTEGRILLSVVILVVLAFFYRRLRRKGGEVNGRDL